MLPNYQRLSCCMRKINFLCNLQRKQINALKWLHLLLTNPAFTLLWCISWRTSAAVHLQIIQRSSHRGNPENDFHILPWVWFGSSLKQFSIDPFAGIIIEAFKVCGNSSSLSWVSKKKSLPLAKKIKCQIILMKFSPEFGRTGRSSLISGWMAPCLT